MHTLEKKIATRDRMLELGEEDCMCGKANGCLDSRLEVNSSSGFAQLGKLLSSLERVVRSPHHESACCGFPPNNESNGNLNLGS